MKKVNHYELKAIEAMEKIFGNKYTLQAENPQPHGAGLLYEFQLSNGEVYFVKVFGDSSSAAMVFKQIEIIELSEPLDYREMNSISHVSGVGIQKPN